MAGHSEGLRYETELWREEKAIVQVVATLLRLLAASPPAAMLDEETTPSPVRLGQEFFDGRGERRQVSRQRGCWFGDVLLVPVPVH